MAFLVKNWYPFLRVLSNYWSRQHKWSSACASIDVILTIQRSQPSGITSSMFIFKEISFEIKDRECTTIQQPKPADCKSLYTHPQSMKQRVHKYGNTRLTRNNQCQEQRSDLYDSTSSSISIKNPWLLTCNLKIINKSKRWSLSISEIIHIQTYIAVSLKVINPTRREKFRMNWR